MTYVELTDEEQDPWRDDEELTADDRRVLFEISVTQEMERQRVRDTARRRLRTEGAAPFPVPKRLDLLLAEPDPLIRYRVDDLWPAHGRVMLTAPFKAGKSTLVANMMRCLVDGGSFLGHWNAVQVTGGVVLIDDELDEDQIRRWLRDQGMRNPDRVHVIGLRGAVSAFNLTDADVRARWAQTLRDLNAEVVILDCLRPILDAIGLDEHKEAGRFLTAFDELLGLSGAAEAVVVHHTGHEGERARGDSRLRDWPDVEWRIVRSKSSNPADPVDPAAKRYFAAYGRDVNVPEGELIYDESRRLLTYGGGSRGQAKVNDAIPAVLDAVRANPEGMSGRAIGLYLTNAGLGRNEARKAMAEALRTGQLIATAGPRNSTTHTLRDDLK